MSHTMMPVSVSGASVIQLPKTLYTVHVDTAPPLMFDKPLLSNVLIFHVQLQKRSNCWRFWVIHQYYRLPNLSGATVLAVFCFPAKNALAAETRPVYRCVYRLFALMVCGCLQCSTLCHSHDVLCSAPARL